MPAVAAIWLLITATLAVTPTGAPFVLGKTLVVAVGVVVAACSVPVGRLPRPVVLAVVGVWIIAVTAAVFSTHVWESLVGHGPRYLGPVSPVVLALVAAVWAGARVVGRDAARRAHVVRALAVVAAGHAAAALIEVVQGHSMLTSDVYRGGGLMGQASDLGALGAVTAAAAIALAGPRGWTWTALLAGSTAAGLSGSRGALVALALGLIVVALYRQVWRLPAAGLIAGVTGLMAAGRDLSGARAVESGASRLEIWTQSIPLIWQSPLGARAPYRRSFEPSGRLAALAETAPLDDPHNVILALGVAGGIPLLLAVTVLAAVVWRHSDRRPVGPVMVALMAAWALTPLSFGALVIPAVVLGAAAASTVTQPAAVGHRAQWTTVPVVVLAVVVLAAVVAEPAASVVRARLSVGMSPGSTHSVARVLRPWDPDLLPETPAHITLTPCLWSCPDEDPLACRRSGTFEVPDTHPDGLALPDADTDGLPLLITPEADVIETGLTEWGSNPHSAEGIPAERIGLLSDAVVWDEPAGAPVGILPETTIGQTTVLPVLETTGDWVLVPVMARAGLPSEGVTGQATGWVYLDDMTVVEFRDRGHVEVNLTARTIAVYERGIEMYEESGIGVGEDITPTPAGLSAISASWTDERLDYTQAPDGSWTPIFGMTRFSDAADDFTPYGEPDRAAPPLLAIHQHTTRDGDVSDGCIRICSTAVDAISALKETVGTPVLVTE